MKTKKLKLENFQVKSFITGSTIKKMNTVKGGKAPQPGTGTGYNYTIGTCGLG